MRTTPSEAFDPIDIASLCLWRQEESGDNRERIRRLLSNLPLAVQQELTPRQREILRLRFTGGMSVTAIAEKLGLNKSTVSRSLARSMERLYKSLRYSLYPLRRRGSSPAGSAAHLREKPGRFFPQSDFFLLTFVREMGIMRKRTDRRRSISCSAKRCITAGRAWG